MTEGINNNLVPPSKRTVSFLYSGATFFYPVRALVAKKGERKFIPDFWPEGGFYEADFAKFLLNMVGGENIDQAVNNILKLKSSWDGDIQPDATVPENLDEMVSALDENAKGEKRLSPSSNDIINA